MAHGHSVDHHARPTPTLPAPIGIVYEEKNRVICIGINWNISR